MMHLKTQFKNIQEVKLSFGKARKRWLVDDESGLKKMIIRS